MHLVNFFDPEIIEDFSKPFPLDNQSFPYTAIANPRRFEELLYSIYKLKIEKGELNEYDSISLMSGIAEQGRDCVLFRNGKAYGIIQCKKYTANLNKDEFGKEITKLILYSLLDDRILQDRNDFTYYIAVAKDFTADCRNLIDDFNNQILSEPNLESWLSTNLNMPTLQSLLMEGYESELKDILSRIKIKKIVPQDLDLELQDKPELQHLFFAVRSVTDNTGTEKILNLLNGNLTEIEIARQLYNGSVSLLSERNTFEGIENSHVQREETTQLLNWTTSEAKKDNNNKIQNICLLAAPAGYGKTVILKDFFLECQTLKIPVLGLKTDKLYSYTITELQNSIGLTLPVMDFIERCKALYPLTIIVIDQIDALSQSMSSDRRFLEVFKGFINRFENDPNIKIIISVRNQDLNYDPTLRQFKKNNTIQVEKLSPEILLQQLEKLGITKDLVSSKLLELLRIPNNLNIFSRIAADINSLKVTTIEELYTELWNQKVLLIPGRVKTNKMRVREALYTVAQKMFKSQRITISAYQLEDFSDEIDYLESEQLIKREDKQLQFFHQSFYDFIFAKQFVESGQDLLVYINESEQSIHIRSAVKMIISYLRDYDLGEYDRYSKQIILHDDIFFHIKHIIFLHILNQPNPTQQELELVKLCLATSMNYNMMFFEYAYGTYWLEFALDNSLLGFIKGEKSKINLPTPELGEQIYVEAIFNMKVIFLQKYVVLNNALSWKYFKQIEDEKIIQKILYFVTDWSTNDPFDMLAKCPDFKILESWSYYRVLENIAKNDIDFVLQRLKETLPERYKKGKRKRDYDEREIIKSVASLAPQKLFPVLYKSMKKDLARDTETIDGLISDWTYSYTDLRDEDHSDGREFLYQMLAYCLKASASKHRDDFRSFFKEHQYSNRYALLRVLLFSLKGNEQYFTLEIMDLFNHFRHLGLLSHGDDLEFEMRSLVENAFTFMNDEQRDTILNVIRNYTDQKELLLWTDDKNRRRRHSIYGLAKYLWLLRLPNDVIQGDVELKKSLMELRRKFPERKDIPKKRSLIAGGVSSPISVDAHKFMKKSHWLSSFRKYNNNRERWGEDFLKGGKTELASAFRNVVEKDPSQEKLEIISAAIDADDIPVEYAISGLYGWTQSKAKAKVILPLFLRVLEKDSSDYGVYVTSIAGRLASLEKTSPVLIDYLCKKSLKFDTEEPVGYETEAGETGIRGLVTKAVNTRHGSAANYLTSVIDVKFKKTVFDTVGKILESGPPTSRAAIFWRICYLTRLDREKAYDLFINSLNREKDVHVIASAINSLQYFRAKGLKVFDAPLRLLIDSGSIGSEDSGSLFTILYGSYLHNQEGAKELLETLIKSRKYNRSSSIGIIIKYYYTVDQSKDKNNALLDFLMSEGEEDDFEEISWNFYHAEHVDLKDISDFVRKFVNSNNFKLTDQFVEYLHSQCGKFTFLAVELFEFALKNDKLGLDDRHSHQIDEKATKFIVSAYEAVNGRDDESKAIRKKLLQSFDKLITDIRFRRNQEKILSDLF